MPIPRFTDNGNGTLTDNLTGLVWLKNVACSAPGKWQAGLDRAKTLADGQCGLTDGSTAGEWRVPNVSELSGLIDRQKPLQYSWLNSQGFSNVAASVYCTSTTESANPSYAWKVGMHNSGDIAHAAKSDGCGSIFAVRGGQSGTFLDLKVTKDGHGSGSVTSEPGSLAWNDKIGTGHFLADSSVTLTAAPNGGSVFSGWSGACTGTAPCTLTMNTLKEVTATFGQNGVCGSAVNVRTIPAPTQNLCEAGVPTTPVGGRFWTWSCNGYEGGSSASCATPPPPAWPLTVAVTGSGKVHSASVPPSEDLNCGGTCVKNYEDGTQVTLSASPTPSNMYLFAGWSGACSGTGNCQVTMTQPETVGATFVLETTPPVLTLPANQKLEATSPAGAVAAYSVSATDNLDPNPTVACLPASGSTFPLGVTPVTCTATDAAGNSASGSFTVEVVDTTAPALTVPRDIEVILNTPVSDPAVMAFLAGASATDSVDTSVTVTASALPALSTIGAKPVTFTAVDDFGNTKTGTAIIHVIYGCGDTYVNSQPIDILTPVDQLTPYKLGSIIPVQLHLCDAQGTDVLTAVAKLYLQPYCGAEPAGDPMEIPSGTADTSNYFGLTDTIYRYNLGTSALVPGMYRIQAVLDDATLRTIPLDLKP